MKVSLLVSLYFLTDCGFISQISDFRKRSLDIEILIKMFKFLLFYYVVLNFRFFNVRLSKISGLGNLAVSQSRTELCDFF